MHNIQRSTLCYKLPPIFSCLHPILSIRAIGFPQSAQKHWSTSSHVCLANHQINFTANWICLDGVWVDVMSPALATRFPVESKIFRLSKGGAKFGWFKMLKNSARNCALKRSEILLM